MLIVAKFERKQFGLYRVWNIAGTENEAEYQGLQDILIGAGLVRERQPYETVVRLEFAEALDSPCGEPG